MAQITRPPDVVVPATVGFTSQPVQEGPAPRSPVRAARGVIAGTLFGLVCIVAALFFVVVYAAMIVVLAVALLLGRLTRRVRR
jgi:hypothetical protein